MKETCNIKDLFGHKPDLDSESIHERIIDFEKRALWIDCELKNPVNFSPDTCRYSPEMMESLQDEMNILNLLANVMYRREKLVSKK